jgi:hypothetical protein
VRRWTLAGALAIFLAAPAQAQDPRKHDFAYGIAVRPGKDAPLYRVRLPLAVYRGVTRSDLGDLRVFNAGGGLVPHELWSPPDREQVERRVIPSRVFPLFESTPEELSAIRIQIESGAERASISLAPDFAPAGVVAYLLDPRPVDPAYAAERLVLHWETPKDGKGGFVRRIRVEESDDLSSWRMLASSVAADLWRDGERLRRNEIPLPSRAARYLRLTSEEGSFPMTLTGVELVLASKTELVETLRVEIPDPRREKGEIHFETPGPILVEEVEISPSERNTWTEVALFSRSDLKGEWIRRAGAAVYRFEVDGDELTETRLPVTSTRDRYWKLTTGEARGGFGSSLPSLSVGYRPDDVVFVARGELPFEIAYGSGRVVPPPRARESLRVLTTSEEKALVPETDLALSEPRTLGGEDVLSGPLIPDWKRFVLWGVLAAASLALLLTARAALRDPGAR